MDVASVTLDEVLKAAQLRAASLVPETSGYLALAIADASARLPFRIEDDMVNLSTEGSVKVMRGTEVVQPDGTMAAPKPEEVMEEYFMPGTEPVDVAELARAQHETPRPEPTAHDPDEPLARRNSSRRFGVGPGRLPLVNSRMIMNTALVSILGVAVVGSTIVVAQRKTDYDFFDPIIEVQQIITRNYKEEVDLKKLQDGAIAGMMETLNDPYSVYVPPAEADEFTKNLTGEYVGIGAQVQLVDRWLTIVSPLEDSPAFKVGLQAEDRVVEIEGTTTQGLSIDKCIEMLMGDPGTKVKITVERKGEKIPFEITRERMDEIGFELLDALGSARARAARNRRRAAPAAAASTSAGFPSSS